MENADAGRTEKWSVSSIDWRSDDNIVKNAKQEPTICTHANIKINAFWGYLYLNPISEIGTIESWISYLADQYAAGTPVQIAYKLAEPVHFTATGAQPIPALAGVNTVLTDADSATVTGRADPIKRITDLEAAVASIN